MDVLEPLPALPDIDEVEPLNASDQACMEELRSVLERHGALQRFGVTLLHEHFEISADEVMMEYVDKDRRELLTKPVAASGELEVNSVQTSWRLDSLTSMQRCERYCQQPYGPRGPHIDGHATVG